MKIIDTILARLAPTAAVTVTKRGHPDDDGRTLEASIDDDPTSRLRLYQTADYAGEQVSIHLNEQGADDDGVDVRADTFASESRDGRAWASLTVSRYWRGIAKDGTFAAWRQPSLRRSSLIFVWADDLVEIRDELTKEIRKARKAGHIS